MPKLSIVITALNDNDLPNTLQSIEDTSGDRCEAVIVNDGGMNECLDYTDEMYEFTIRLIENTRRCGVGPSRTIGVHHATGDYVMIIDSHMRFKPGWYEEVIRRVEGRDKTIHCAVCAGLDSKNTDVNNPKGRYYGARFVMIDKDPNAQGRTRILEGAWNKEAPEDDAELSCCMGANYVMAREWFLKLDALRFLRSWGGDEQMLSIKSWLAGGDVRLIRNVEVGHIFLQGDERPPYKTPVGHVAHNKLWAMLTLIPQKYHEEILHHLVLEYGGGELSTGQKIIAENMHLIETEIARNASIFKHSFEWYADRHGIALNGKK